MRRRRCEQREDEGAARGLTAHRHAARVAAKCLGVSLHPPQCCEHVEQAIVSNLSLSTVVAIGERVEGEPAGDAESVLDADDDSV